MSVAPVGSEVADDYFPSDNDQPQSSSVVFAENRTGKGVVAPPSGNSSNATTHQGGSGAALQVNTTAPSNLTCTSSAGPSAAVCESMEETVASSSSSPQQHGEVHAAVAMEGSEAAGAHDEARRPAATSDDTTTLAQDDHEGAAEDVRTATSLVDDVPRTSRPTTVPAEEETAMHWASILSQAWTFSVEHATMIVAAKQLSLDNVYSVLGVVEALMVDPPPLRQAADRGLDAAAQAFAVYQLESYLVLALIACVVASKLLRMRFIKYESALQEEARRQRCRFSLSQNPASQTQRVARSSSCKEEGKPSDPPGGELET